MKMFVCRLIFVFCYNHCLQLRPCYFRVRKVFWYIFIRVFLLCVAVVHLTGS